MHRYTAIPSVPDFPGAGAVCRADAADGIGMHSGYAWGLAYMMVWHSAKLLVGLLSLWLTAVQCQQHQRATPMTHTVIDRSGRSSSAILVSACPSATCPFMSDLSS